MFFGIVIAIFLVIFLLFIILKKILYIDFYYGPRTWLFLFLGFILFSLCFEFFQKECNISEQIKAVDDISICSVYENADGTIRKITYINNISDVITVVDVEENDIVFDIDIKDDVKSATKVEISEESYYSILDLCDKVVNTIYAFS